MSPKLPVLTAKDVVRLLKERGFSLASQKGSHAKFRHADGWTTAEARASSTYGQRSDLSVALWGFL